MSDARPGSAARGSNSSMQKLQSIKMIHAKRFLRIVVCTAAHAAAYVISPLPAATQRVHSETRACTAAAAAQPLSAEVAKLSVLLRQAREEARGVSGIKLVNAQEAVDALLDRIDKQLHLEAEVPAPDAGDEAIAASVEDAIGKVNLRLKGRRASPPTASAAGSNAAATSQDSNILPAEDDVKASLLKPAINVPHVQNVREWLPDVRPQFTPYHGGCMSDVLTLMEEECVVPLAISGTFVGESHVVLADPVVRADATAIDLVGATAYKAGGPREEVVFRAEEVKAAVVTCGGLCPGLNTVVKELVICLRAQYGVSTVYGIKYGYMGFYTGLAWAELGLADVETIHRQGGSVLGSSRGGHDTMAICDAIEAAGVNMVFTIGGDGTMRGSRALAEEFIARKAKVVVAHVPKTIDNDIPLLDATFGFGTAVQEATRAIFTARDEAVAYPNGVGIVNLMGRHSGFIAAHATMAARGVDVCLIPEVPFELEGPDGLLRYIESRVAQKGYCVVVVAEGSGQDLLNSALVGVDASGNKGLAEIGPYLKGRVIEHFKQIGAPASVKYVDPTYMVRAAPATAADNILCLQLAHDAVHGAFAGYTSFISGRVNGRAVYIPIATAAGRRNIAPTGNFWQQLVFATGQPNWRQRQLEDTPS